MKTAGIDIGTTTISGVVLEKEENGQAKILEAKTVENGCFIETGNEWERIQYAKEIVERAVNLLDYFLEKYPHVERIGLTGQMHGIVYVDKEGNCVSPLYTWQDARGSICYGVLKGMSTELYQMYTTIQKETGIKIRRMIGSGNGLRKNPVLCEIIEDMFKAELVLADCEEEAATGAAMSSSMYNSSNSPR